MGQQYLQIGFVVHFMAKDGEASVVLRNPDIASVKGRQICFKISAICISDLRETLTLKMDHYLGYSRHHKEGSGQKQSFFLSFEETFVSWNSGRQSISVDKDVLIWAEFEG